jgi:hypothetical protein
LPSRQTCSGIKSPASTSVSLQSQTGSTLTDFEKPSTAIGKLGVRPEDVTDIITDGRHTFASQRS